MSPTKLMRLYQEAAREFEATVVHTNGSHVRISGDGWQATLPRTPRYEITEKILRRILAKAAAKAAL